MTPAHLARACVEGVLCGLADALDALRDSGLVIRRVVMIGGGARSEAVRRIAPQVFGTEVLVPPAVEAVADGAARQAAWALAGTDAPPAVGGAGRGQLRRRRRTGHPRPLRRGAHRDREHRGVGV